MSYSISWHRLPIEEDDVPYKEPQYTEEELELLKQHSSLCGCLEYDKIPFEYERTGLNITFNLSEMFSWAINGDSKKYWRESLHGKKGEYITPLLKKAVERMEKYPNKAKEYDSPNGWGTYPNALRFLKDLLAESIYWKDFYLNIER